MSTKVTMPHVDPMRQMRISAMTNFCAFLSSWTNSLLTVVMNKRQPAQYRTTVAFPIEALLLISHQI